MAKKEWKALLDKANENLKEYDAQLVVSYNNDRSYDLYVVWSDGDSERYASDYYDSEMGDLINEAWGDVRVKFRKRGDRIIRVIRHIDTSDKDWTVGYLQHDHAFCGNETAAANILNRYLDGVLDGVTVTGEADVPAVNAALKKKFKKAVAYVSWEDITEEVVIKCAELFCEHHWGHEALVRVADELGIDLYDIEKS